MKKLPEVNVSFESFRRMLMAPLRPKLMMTGIELKVFNHLSEPVSASELACRLGFHEENTRIFLDGLTAIKLIVKKDGLYRNTPVAQVFLVESEPTYLGPFIGVQEGWLHPAIDDLPRLVREGPPPQEKDKAPNEAWQAQMAMAMANYQRAGSAQRAAKVVSALPEFPSFRKMLDLGGAAGLVGIAIVAKHPDMKGIIFDQPEIVKVAESFIREYDMEERMGVIGGDFMKDPIGDGYDLVWASATLNFARFDMDTVVQKVYDALNPGGVFISYHPGLTEERTQPEGMILGWMSLALKGQDLGLDQGAVADAMLRAGFKSVRGRTIDSEHGPMDMDIGRK